LYLTKEFLTYVKFLKFGLILAYFRHLRNLRMRQKEKEKKGFKNEKIS